MKKVFERDYSKDPYDEPGGNLHADTTEEDWVTSFFEYRTDLKVKNASVVQPCVVREGAEANFAALFRICNKIAGHSKAFVRGVVDYEKCDAHIEMVLPFLEFSTAEDMKDLRDMSDKAVTVLFQSAPGDKVKVWLSINYFHRIILEDEDTDLSDEITRNDISHFSLMFALANLPAAVENTYLELAAILNHIVEETGISRTEVVPAMIGEMKAHGIGLTDLSGARMIADNIISAYKKT